MIANLLQLWVLVTTGASVWLMSNPHNRRYRRLGCWLGLAAQPVWFFSTFQNFQWGMFLLSIVFTVSYLRGLARIPRY